MKFQYITLTNNQVVEGLFEAVENEQTKTTFTRFDYKELTNSNVVKKIAFVNQNGNKVKLF